MTPVPRDNGFRRKRVTVVGLGLEGIDLVRFLHSRGARITVSDAKPAEALAPSLEQIASIPTRLSLGANDPKDMPATSSRAGEMFRHDGKSCFVGGNIGVGLLTHLDKIASDTWVILEVSHTQLQVLPDRSPHVAWVLNITPNHLDRFTCAHYWRLKANILRGQT